MPKAKRGSSRSSSSRRQSKSARSSAIDLLKADHREVEGLFSQFEKARTDGKKAELAKQICQALRVHTTIEEELFYPAFLEAAGEEDIHHEAEVEHDGAKKLIAEIEGSGPDDDYFDAKVSVLSEMIKHHVEEEERPSGMFGKAKQSEMDLQELGEQLKSRKMQLMQAGGKSSRKAGGVSKFVEQMGM